IVDSSPADGLKIFGISPTARPEDKLSPKLKVNPRVGKAPIESVAFFFGEADKDHKIPEKSKKFPAVLEKDGKTWAPKDDLIVPPDVLGSQFLSAQVETATGVLMTTKEPIVVRAGGAVGGGGGLATIAGVLVYGDRKQPGLDVFLAKAKP